ncbi:regucalcin-like [Littorina saxatilis]|uniref:Regucalcin n=1 Tax=Littorina saxatilis TaxID=31220 RepID=A0AAN9G9P9_9CAEN
MASPKAQVQMVYKNCARALGEGPHWDDRTQHLIFIDILNREVHRWDPTTGKDELRRVDDTVGVVVPRRKGGYILGLGRRFASLDWDTGKTTTIKEVGPENPRPSTAELPDPSAANRFNDTGNRFNDGKCDPMGRLWTGTIGPFGPGGFVAGSGCLYSLNVDRTVTLRHSGVDLTNGMAFSNDNATLFYIDSTPKNIYAFDYDPQAGNLSSERTVRQFEDSGGSPYTAEIPDSMTIDTDGKLWVAMFNGGKVLKLDPETGKTLQTINFPVTQTTSVAWGGRNLDELYVTTGRLFPEEEFKKQPLAGSLFKVTGLGARGRPAYLYEG